VWCVGGSCGYCRGPILSRQGRDVRSILSGTTLHESNGCEIVPSSNTPPKKLNDKHALVAYLALAGATNVEIAASLDYHPNRVAAIRDSPLFKTLLTKLQGDLRQRTVGSVIDKIIAEGPGSVNVLVELRDHAEGEMVRLNAARDLLDRNPDTAKVSREDRREEVRILLDTSAIQRLTGALADMGEIVDAEVTPMLPPAEGAFGPPTGGILTLEEVIAQVAAAESAS